MMTDTVSDLLTRVRNAQKAGHSSVVIRKSIMAKRVLDVLLREGFVAGIEEKEDAGKKVFCVTLKYFAVHEPVISTLDRVSKPGRRVYKGYEELPKISQGLGILVLSTSQGIMSDREARYQKLGGEVLARVC